MEDEKFKKELEKCWKRSEKELPLKGITKNQIYLSYTERITLSQGNIIDIEDIAGNNIRFIGLEELELFIEKLNKIKDVIINED